MNSLLGGLGNMLLNSTKASPMMATNNTAQMPSILMQAMGAALRGETPQDFLSKLAESHPQLRQYDLSNLQQTAQQICQQNGVDMQQAINSIDNIASSFMPSTR